MAKVLFLVNFNMTSYLDLIIKTVKSYYLHPPNSFQQKPQTTYRPFYAFSLLWRTYCLSDLNAC